MRIRFSQEVDRIAAYARDEAMRTGWYGIGTDHLFLGILRHSDNDVCDLLRGLEVDLSEFKEYIDSMTMKENAVPYNDLDKVRLTRSARNIMSLAVYEALKYGSETVLTTHLLLAMMRGEESWGRTYLNGLDLSYESIGAMMAEQDMLGSPAGLRPAAEKETPVQAIDLSGVLGEQLGILFESVSNKSNNIS